MVAAASTSSRLERVTDLCRRLEEDIFRRSVGPLRRLHVREESEGRVKRVSSVHHVETRLCVTHDVACGCLWGVNSPVTCFSTEAHRQGDQLRAARASLMQKSSCCARLPSQSGRRSLHRQKKSPKFNEVIILSLSGRTLETPRWRRRYRSDCRHVRLTRSTSVCEAARCSAHASAEEMAAADISDLGDLILL